MLTQAESFAILASAQPEAFKAVVDLTADFRILCETISQGSAPENQLKASIELARAADAAARAAHESTVN